MSDIAALVSDHLDIWTAAIERKNGAGRGDGKRVSLYGIERLRALIFDLAAAGRLEGNTNVAPEPLGKHVDLVMGQAPPGSACNTTGVGTVFVKTGEFGPVYPEVREWTTKPLKMAQAGDVLICVVGATIGKLNLAIDCAIGRSVAAIRPKPSLDARYLYFALMPYTLRLRRDARGSAQGVIGKSELNAVAIRVPTLEEQRRIVAKVDELMALCDALEAESAKALAAHQTLVETLLATLVNSADAADLAANWSRLEAHFDTLFTTEASVDVLKQTILELAVRGRLVPQARDDEPATQLAQQLRKAIPKAKLHPPVLQEEIPFELPEGWVWERFDHLIQPEKPIAYGVLVPGNDEPDGVPFVRVADLSITDPAPLPGKAISPDVDAQFLRTRLEGGEILMGVVGSIGKLGVVPASWEGANIARAICRIVPAEQMNKAYLIWLLQSKYMQDKFKGDARTLAQPTLNIKLIRIAPTPVPPVAEQGRIVAKVDDLMAICDSLKARIAVTREIQMRLADAIVERAAA